MKYSIGGKHSSSQIATYRFEILLILAITLIFWLPLVFVRGLFWDDWVELWLYSQFGFDTLLNVLYQNAHVGWTFIYGLWYVVGQGFAGSLSRATAIIAHAINAYFLLKIISRNPKYLGAARLFMLFFLFSPFYTGRVSFNFNAYDVFLLLYLASIVLLDYKSILIKSIALVLLLFALSFETLIALEVLRLFYIYQRSSSWRDTFKACYPAWIVGAIFLILRFTVLEAHGIYAGYHSLHFSWQIFYSIYGNYRYYVQMIGWDLLLSIKLLSLYGLIASLALVVGLSYLMSHVAVVRSFFKPLSFTNDHGVLWFAVIFSLVAIIPYALIHEYPSLNFGSRLVGAAVIGVMLIPAVLVLYIPNATLRLVIIGVTLFLCMTTLIYNQKWAFFDDLIQKDLYRQLALYEFNLKQPEVTLVGIRPLTTKQIMYQRRCLYPQDFNAPEMLWNNHHHLKNVFYSLNCYSHFVHFNAKTHRFMKPCVRVFGKFKPQQTYCPKRVTKLIYQLLPQYQHLSDISIVRLIYWSLRRSSSDPVMGHLINTTQGDRLIPYRFSLWDKIKPQNSLLRYMEGMS